MPFELSKAFFSVLSGCFYREKPHRAKNESGMNHFLRHHQNASCKKRYKEIGMVLWYTVSIKNRRGDELRGSVQCQKTTVGGRTS